MVHGSIFEISHISHLSADERIPPIYKFDSTDVSAWNENVRDRAYRLLTHLRGEDDKEMTTKATKTTEETSTKMASSSTLDSSFPEPECVTLNAREEETSECLTCRRFFTSQDQLAQHLGSKQHRKAVSDLNDERKKLFRTMRAVEEEKRKRKEEDSCHRSDHQQEASEKESTQDVIDKKDIRCEPCKRKFESEDQLTCHVTSKKHKKKVFLASSISE